MKRLLYVLCCVLTGTLVLSACSKDEAEELTSDCYISAVTLGTLKRVTTSNGTPTQTTYNGAYYPLSIDQRRGVITNTTPLLTGTDLSAALVTITAKGTVVYAPEHDQTVWQAWTSTDSIDFRHPLLFRVYATNGAGYREYRLTLTARTQDAGSYMWEDLEAPFLATRKARQAVAWNGGILLLSADEGDALHCNTWSDGAWGEDTSCSGTGGAVPATLCCYGNALWMSTSGGDLLRSADGVAWNTLTPAAAHRVTLLGASPVALYARIHDADTGDDFIGRSTDGTAWTSIDLEKDLALFPAETRSVSYVQNKNSRMLVAGTTAGGSVSVWNMDEDHDTAWMLFAQTGDNDYILPWTATTTLIAYNNTLIAIDGTSSTTYRSQDNGITWKSYTELQLPTTDTRFATVVLGDYIYTFAGGKMQRAVIVK